MSSKEMPPSSDESETIDVGNIIQSLFGDIEVDPIPVEIVDDLLSCSLNDDDKDTIIVTGRTETEGLKFNSMNDNARHVAALKFSLVINAKIPSK